MEDSNPDLAKRLSRDRLIAADYAAPHTALEKILAPMWADLLGVDRVGRSDQFFDLGGHSLLIVRMLESLRQLGFAADFHEVFDNPTLCGFASALEHGGANASQTGVAPNLIVPGCTRIDPAMLPLIDLTTAQIDHIVRTVPGGAGNVQDIYPLAPLQQGMLFHHLLNGQGDTYIHPLLFELASPAQLEALIDALQTVIERHDALRTAMVWEQLPQPVQVVYRSASLSASSASHAAADGGGRAGRAALCVAATSPCRLRSRVAQDIDRRADGVCRKSLSAIAQARGVSHPRGAGAGAHADS
jgi:syringomycin synthetase protein SyrE